MFFKDYYKGRVHFFSLVILILLYQGNIFAQVTAPLLNPLTQPKFVNPLPIPNQIDGTKGGTFDIEMNASVQWLGLVDPISGTKLMTNVWGYGQIGNGVTYPGPTFIAKKDVPIYVNWYNNLPGHFLPVDPTLHMAHPHVPADVTDKVSWIRDWYSAGNVPTVAHLHGGHTESASDGLPEAWFTQGVNEVGQYFLKTNYVYHNDQEAATLWYHDHALGITRLNVYAGLAGFYLLEDKNERDLVKKNILPKGKQDIEIVIQDRMFDTNGQLYWPSKPGDPAYDDFIIGEEAELPTEHFPGGGPTVLAEFFGNMILVNGMAWPYLRVEPRPYRFRFLNGSDSRFYVLQFENNMSFIQIATDDGLLQNPVELNQLIIAPGERIEIVVDFKNRENENIRLLNFGPDSPFGGLPIELDEIANPATTGQIMQFRVDLPLKAPRGLPIPTIMATGESTQLRGETNIFSQLSNQSVAKTRKLALFEGKDEYGRLQPLLGVINGDEEKNINAGTYNGSLAWFEPITENPGMNDVEIWEFYNSTMDAHPIHMHLVAFQIIDRQPFSAIIESQPQLNHMGDVGEGAYIKESSISYTGPAEEPVENEKGWKDTFIVPPGYVGRVKAKFDRVGRYVWHCHILSHEDHEMMRPYEVMETVQKKSSNLLATVSDYKLEQNFPNPFNPTTIINFSIPVENTLVSLKIYNSLGEEVGTIFNQFVQAGNHQVNFDASDLSSGIYFYALRAGDFVDIKKMVLMK